jgi:hypothetical protein
MEMFIIRLQDEIIEKVIELIKKYAIESDNPKLLEIYIYIDNEYYISRKYKISRENAYKLTKLIPDSYIVEKVSKKQDLSLF